jgi:hypothetical protein
MRTILSDGAYENKITATSTIIIAIKIKMPQVMTIVAAFCSVIQSPKTRKLRIYYLPQGNKGRM